MAVLLIFPALFLSVYAQSTDPAQQVIDQKAKLQAELAELEKEIANFQGLISEKQSEGKTLSRDLTLLDAQIKKAQLEIKARTLAISNLQGAIGQKNETISSLEEKIEREKLSLAELLRAMHRLDQSSIMEVLLGYSDLSDFFEEAESFSAVQGSLQSSFEKIRTNKTLTEIEKESLEDRQGQELQLKSIQEMERRSVQERENEKKKILAETKGQEKTYKTILNDRNKTAAQIRAALFTLNGSAAIPFDKAYQYAVLVEKQVGIRPAFLLGIIAEESNLGANVGTGNWRDDLSHARCQKQRVVFAEITARLGLNPDSMPVSKKAWYGYCGGAMGPAQFIPTTWILYEDKVASLTGNNPANPWNPLDAFMASGLLLRDNGAAARTYKAEHTAALKYLAGGNWSNPSYRFYGDDVMGLAQKYQEQIDILSSDTN